MTFQSRSSFYSGTRVLVTGATGFIGRWVARALSRQGAQLYAVVRKRSSAQEIFERFEIDAIPIEADLRDANQTLDLLTTIQPEITFNLAGYGVDRKECDEMMAYQINAQLGFRMCQVLNSMSPSLGHGQSFVHVGSALEYGRTDGNLTEDSETHPTTLYGKSKLLGTELIVQSCKAYGVRGLIARLFTVYGPGEHEGRLLPTLLRAANTNEPIPLTTGEQMRDFVYVEDVAEGLLQLGAADSELGEIVNLATGHLTSVRKFVETAAEVLQISPDRLQFGALPPLREEMHHAPVSTERLARLTDWSPATGIGEGIRQTHEFEEHVYAHS